MQRARSRRGPLRAGELAEAVVLADLTLVLSIISQVLPFLGGAMSSADGLVFYGTQRGDLKAVDAKTGKVLWQFNVGTGILQSPITYMMDGKQYLAVVAGRIKGPPSFLGKIGQKVIDATAEGGMLVVFELGN